MIFFQLMNMIMIKTQRAHYHLGTQMKKFWYSQIYFYISVMDKKKKSKILIFVNIFS